MQNRLMILLLALGGLVGAQAAQTKPNVVVFLVDDLGWTDIGYHPTMFPQGSTYYETPNLLALAEGGVSFSDAHAMPLCSPTRASLMSGQYAARLDYNNAGGSPPPDPDYVPQTDKPLLFPENNAQLYQHITTFADYLNENHGYHTWHIGKWHIGGTVSTDISAPRGRGFDQQFYVGGAGLGAGHFAPISGVQNMVYPDDPTPNSAQGTKYQHSAQIMTEISRQLIHNHSTNSVIRDEPFFLNFWHYVVHTPIQAHYADVAAFAGKTPDLRGHDNPYYAAMIKYWDDSLGQLVQALKDAGEFDDTLFFFAGDNGGLDGAYFDTVANNSYDPDGPGSTATKGVYTNVGIKRITENKPLRGGKVSIYEGGVRVPAMVCYPNGNLQAGTRVETPIHVVDFFPTVLDFLGEGNVAEIEDRNGAPQPLDGASLRPLLEGSGSFADRALFCYWPRVGWYAASVRRGDYKLYRWFVGGHDGGGRVELFNLADDLGETHNLTEELPQLATQLLAELDHWVMTTANHPPIPNPDYAGGQNDPETAYEPWILGYKPDATPAEMAQEADLEPDGWNNLAEYLFGGNPVSNSVISPLLLDADNNSHAVFFTVPVARQAAYTLMRSDNLSSNFYPVTSPVVHQGGTNFGPTQFNESFLYKTTETLADGCSNVFYTLSGEAITIVVPPSTGITAVASGSITNPATWGRPAPVAGDANTWLTGAKQLTVPANPTTFNGQTFVVQSGGEFRTAAPGPTVNMHQMVLDGGLIFSANNLPFKINLTGDSLTLNSGTLRSGSTLRSIQFLDGSLAGSGTITVDAPGTSTGSQIEFTSTIDTTGFTGIFDVKNKGRLNLPPVATASFGLRISGTGTYVNDADVAVVSLEIEGHAFPSGTYTYATIGAAYQPYLGDNGKTITVAPTIP